MSSQNSRKKVFADISEIILNSFKASLNPNTHKECKALNRSILFKTEQKIYCLIDRYTTGTDVKATEQKCWATMHRCVKKNQYFCYFCFLLYVCVYAMTNGSRWNKQTKKALLCWSKLQCIQLVKFKVSSHATVSAKSERRDFFIRAVGCQSLKWINSSCF